MRRIIVAVLVLFGMQTSRAQYFQFSQYNFTPQRVNPAQVASSNYAAVSIDHRNQATDGGFHLTTNILNVSYPFIARTGRRWSGVGLTFMDDRSGQAGIFNTQEAGLSYALNVPLARYQTFSLGVKALYQSRKIDLGGLFTGAQYVPDRGFSEVLSSGESVGQFSTNFFTFSAGLHWQKTDIQGTRLAYWGISFFDFNKPNNAFLGEGSHLNSTIVASLGIRVYQRGNVSLFPEVLYTRYAANNVLNAGIITRYNLKPFSKKAAAHINLITKYVVGRSGIAGLQLYKENFTVGITYDFPILVKNVANTGALEVGVELRKLVLPRKRNNRTAKQKPRTPAEHKPAGQSPEKKKIAETIVVQEQVSRDTIALKPFSKDNLGSRLKQKQDSVKASAAIGLIQHQPLVLEKATLDFSFEFNSVAVNDKTAKYLDDLAEVLKDNPELRIRLVGHTDNVGSEKFNLKLSQHRAQKMKEYLVKKGVEDFRIFMEGKGMSEPLNGNATEEERAQNRRVELTILYHQRE